MKASRRNNRAMSRPGVGNTERYLQTSFRPVAPRPDFVTDLKNRLALESKRFGSRSTVLQYVLLSLAGVLTSASADLCRDAGGYHIARYPGHFAPGAQPTDALRNERQAPSGALGLTANQRTSGNNRPHIENSNLFTQSAGGNILYPFKRPDLLAYLVLHHIT